MNTSDTLHLDPTAAETAAERAERLEAEAERRFDELHARLQASGRVAESTRSEEFRQWMAARAATDEAWGRWAMAVESQAHG